MSDEAAGRDAQYPESRWALIDVACARFEAAWQTGPPPRIDDFLPSESSDNSGTTLRSVLMQLVGIDLEWRWKTAEIAGYRQTVEKTPSPPAPLPRTGEGSKSLPLRPRLSDYVARYAQLGPVEQLPNALIVDEYYSRRRYGDRPTHAEYVYAFGSRHANLASQLQAIDDGMAAGASPPEQAAADEDGLPPGSTVQYFGDYVLLEPLGKGGMGIVYKAKQVSLKRIVAVKMILAGQLAGEEDVARFRSEAESAAALDHPNIVQIYEFGEHQGQHYFSMRYVEGESLAERLKASPLPAREAARLIEQVARAIAYAHGRGVIHRDLKPANIIVDGQGQPHATDFGLAKRVQGDSDLTATGQILGTPSYMSPEQASGRLAGISARSDVYSLGATLYALLVGRPPFQADNPLDTLLQVREQDPVSLRQLNPKLPRDLETICAKCLEKDQRRRYASAEELGGELQRFLAGEPIHARPVSRPERFWRWCKRQPVVAGLIAAIALTLIAGTIISSFFAVKSRANAAVATANEGKWRQSATEAEAEKERSRQKAAEALAEKERANVEKKRADAKAIEAQSERERARRKATEALAEKERAERQLLRSEWLLYASQIARALRECETNNVVAAWQSLSDCRADFRGWEFGYVEALLKSNQRTLKGHTAPVLSVVFSPDGTRIVTGSDDKSLKVWNATTGQELLTLKGHAAPVASVAFSADGKRIVSGSLDNKVKVWDAMSGQETLTVAVEAQPHAVSGVTIIGNGNLTLNGMNVDGNLIITGSGDVSTHGDLVARPVRHRDLIITGSGDMSTGGIITSGKPQDATSGPKTLPLKVRSDGVLGVAFSADGKLIVRGSGDNALHIWDAKSGQEVYTIKTDSGGVGTIPLGVGGTQMVLRCDDLALTLWDATLGQETLRVKKLRGAARSVVAFSPDGKRIASGSDDNSLKVWEAAGSSQMLTLKGNTAPVISVAFSADGKRIVSGSDDNSMKVWDAKSCRETLMIRKPAGSVRSTVAFSADGERVVSGSDSNRLVVWDASNGRKILTLKRGAVSGHVAPSTSDQNRHSEKNDLTVGYGEGLMSVAVSPDGNRIVSVSADGMPIVWDVTTGQEALSLKQSVFPVTGVAFSADGNQIVGGSEYGGLTVWDATTGKEMLALKAQTGTMLFSAGGRRGYVTSVAFSPDGKWIVSGGSDDTLLVWDATTGQKKLTLKGHTRRVTSVAFSPDGKRIISGSLDKTVKLWEATTGQELLTLKGYTGSVLCVAFSPDGKRIVSGSDDKKLVLWKATSSDGGGTSKTADEVQR